MIFPYFLIFFSSTLVFFPSLQGDFVFDDRPAIINNQDLDIQTLANLSVIFKHDFWGENLTSSNSHKSYRPLTTLTFWLQKQIFSSDQQPISTFQFHALNILIHGINSLLAFQIFKVFFRPENSLVASLIFSLHPVHTESVAGIVGRADLLYSLIVLTGLLHSLKTADASFKNVTAKILLQILFCCLSTLCKELGIVLIPMILAVEILLKHNSKFFPTLGCAKVTLLIFKIFAYSSLLSCIVFWRMYLVDFNPPTFQEGDNPFAFINPLLLKWINISFLYSVNSWILLAPNWLCFDWAFHCIQPIKTIYELRVIFVVLFYSILASLCVLSLKRNDSKVVLFLCFVVLSFVPASNIVFNVGFVIAERNLYLCVLGYSALVVTGLHRLLKRLKSTKYRKVFRFVTVLILLIFAFKSWRRSIDWQTEQRLYTSGLRVCPGNAKIYYNIAKLAADNAAQLSNTKESMSERQKAVSFYNKALQLWPNYEHAMNNLGNLYRQMGDNYEAKKLLVRALEIQPKFAACWMNLGVVQANLNELADAEYSYKMALSQRKSYPDCHYNLGTLYLKTENYEKARQHFTIAIQLRPKHFPSWANLVTLLDNLEMFFEAEQEARSAIQIFPEKADFYFQLGNILGKQNRFEAAEAMYLTSIQKDGKNKALTYSNLGVLYHRWKKLDKAVESYEKALSLDPENQSAQKNLNRLIAKKN